MGTLRGTHLGRTLSKVMITISPITLVTLTLLFVNLRASAAVIGAFLFIGSMLVVANTIKLAVYARRKGSKRSRTGREVIT